MATLEHRREDGFQHSPRYRQGFIRDQAAVARVIAWIKIANFETRFDPQAGVEQPAQHPFKWGVKWMTIHLSDQIPLLKTVADGTVGMKFAFGWRP